MTPLINEVVKGGVMLCLKEHVDLRGRNYLIFFGLAYIPKKIHRQFLKHFKILNIGKHTFFETLNIKLSM